MGLGRWWQQKLWCSTVVIRTPPAPAVLVKKSCLARIVVVVVVPVVAILAVAVVAILAAW